MAVNGNRKQNRNTKMAKQINANGNNATTDNTPLIKVKSGSVANNKITIALDSNATKQLFTAVRDRVKKQGIVKNKDIVTLALYQLNNTSDKDIKALVDKLTN